LLRRNDFSASSDSGYDVNGCSAKHRNINPTTARATVIACSLLTATPVPVDTNHQDADAAHDIDSDVA
jgi:hypothetical protein